MQTKTILQTVFMLAVVLFAPLATMQTTQTEAQRMNDTVEETTHCDPFEGRLMPESTPHNRHAFKRAVRRFSLRFGRRRQKWRIIRRLFGIGKTAPQCPVSDEQNPTPETEQANICPICLDVECDTAPHFTNGLCADCNIDEGHLETTENRRTATISAVIASVSFALIVAIVAPKLLSSGLFLVGATRQPKPANLRKWGKNARKHSKNATQCIECGVRIDKGDFKVMLPHGNYKQNKPHCVSCAQAEWDMNVSLGRDPITGKAPTQNQATAPQPEPSNKPFKVRVIHQGHKTEPQTAPQSTVQPAVVNVEPSSTPEQIAQQIAALLSNASNQGGILNADEVYDQTQSQIDQNNTHIINPKIAGLRKEMDNAITAQAEQISTLADKIKSSAPIVPLMVQKSKSAKPVNCGDVYHPQVPTVFSILTCRTKKGTPLPVYLVGEAGGGKSFCVATVRRMLREGGFLTKKTDNYGEVVCFADMERGDLLGRIAYNTNTGVNTWNKSGLVKPLLEGGVAFIDEIDKADPAVLTLLNGVLASRTIIDPSNGEVLPVHKDCFIIAAGNTTGMTYDPNYVSAQKQDLSLIDRFSGCVVEYGRSQRVMAGMLGLKNAPFEVEKTAHCEPATAQELFDAYGKICEMTEQSAVSFSYRALEHGEAMARNGWGIEQIVARWSQILDDELKRSVAKSFNLDSAKPMSELGMIPESVWEGVNIAGGA